MNFADDCVFKGKNTKSNMYIILRSNICLYFLVAKFAYSIKRHVNFEQL